MKRNPALKISTIIAIFFISFLNLNIAHAADYYESTEIFQDYIGEGGGVVSDSDNNVYTSGFFEGTQDFDPSSGTDIYTSIGTFTAFVTKTDSNGNYVWTKTLQGTGNSASTQVRVDSDANLYVTGYYSGTVDFDPSSGTYNLTSVGSNDFFAAKYTSNGIFVWARSFGSTSDEGWTDTAVDSDGNLYLVTSFAADIDFDGTSGVDIRTPDDGDGFIVKYDTNGNYKWTNIIGGDGYDVVNGVELDNSGEPYVVGIFSTTVDFDPGASTVLKTSNGDYDAFIGRYDADDGHYVWIKTFGGTGNDTIQDIAIDSSNNIYAIGNMASSTVDLDPSSKIDNHTLIGTQDTFVAKYSTDGTYRWARNFGGTGTDVNSAWITANDAGDTYSAGTFTNTVDFNPGSGISSVTTSSTGDSYINVLDKEGNFRWVSTFESTNYNQINTIYYANLTDKLYAVGFITADTNFDTQGSGDVITVVNAKDRFLTVFNDDRDNFAPDPDSLNISKDKRKKYLKDGESTNDENVSIRWNKSDNVGPAIIKYTIHLKRVRHDKNFKRMGSVDAETTHYKFKDLKDGKYEWYVKAVDTNNNDSKSKTYTFTVDTKAPESFVISKLNNKPILNNAVRPGATKSLFIEGTAEPKTSIYIDVFNRDKSIKFETLKCKVEDNGIFNCNLNADIKNTTYTFSFYSADNTGNKSEAREVKVN
jgi:hypothetical protein